MQLSLVSSFTVFLAGIVYIHAQDADFLDSATDPAFILQVVGAFAQGRCWNFYSSDARYPEMPNRDDYQDVLFSAAEAKTHIPAKTDGPISMRGLFHLQIPDMVPEIVTFEDTREGGGLGEPLQGNPPARRQRIMSEGNWGAPFSAENADFITGDNDLILEWVVREGTAEEPLAFDIFVDVKLPVLCFRTSTDGCGMPFQQWSAILQNVPGTSTAHPIYPNSYVWRRESMFEGKMSSYEAVQVVDGNGVDLEPAWSNWVSVASRFGDFFTKYLNSPTASPVCGSRPFWCVIDLPFVCG